MSGLLRHLHRSILALLLLAPIDASAASPVATRQQLEPLEDDDMASVVGAQGVVLDIKLRNNVNASYAPIGCTIAVGAPNPCRMGLEFAARNGIWLMLKEYYGTLHLKDFRLDATLLPSGNTTHYNPARFRDSSGGDLIVGANPANQPAILMSYPATDAQGTYDDLIAFMNIGRAWLEFDCSPSGSGATLCNPATPGYKRDTTLDSALSIRFADSAALNSPARMRFWGSAYVYGF